MPGVGPMLGGLLAVANLLAPLHQSRSPLQTHRDFSGHDDAERCPAHVLHKMLQCQCFLIIICAVQAVQTQHATLQKLCNLWLIKIKHQLKRTCGRLCIHSVSVTFRHDKAAASAHLQSILLDRFLDARGVLLQGVNFSKAIQGSASYARE
jgi:hypothetical protein